MIKTCVIALLVCAAACTVCASTVVLQGGFGYPAGESATGEALQPGFEVSVGTFAPGFNPVAAPADFAALRAQWIEYAKTATAVIDGVPGSFYLKHINNDPAFAGRPVYLFLTRTSDFASPAADGSNVTDYGIFTSTHASWIFPAVGAEVLPPADLIQINTAQIDSAHWGTADATSVALAFRTGVDQSSAAWNAWVQSLLGSNPDPELLASLADPSATLPGAPLNNLLSFALNANPLEPGPVPFEILNLPDGDRFTPAIRFTRRKNSGYLTRAVASTDLADWSLPLTETITASSETTETVVAHPSMPTDKAFFRIQVAPES